MANSNSSSTSSSSSAVKLEKNPLAKDLAPDKIKKAAKTAINAGIKQFLSEVAKGFDQQQAPGGSKWEALSPAYERFKIARWGSKPILEATGDLKKAALSPQTEVTTDGSSGGSSSGGGGGGSGGQDDSDYQVTASMTVHDPQNIALYHQFGTPTMPARPFFQVEGQAAQHVGDAMTDTFDKSLGL